MIDRDHGPRHKICGEFLSHEAQRYLADLGLDLDRLGGRPIATLRLIHGGELAETDLPFRGLGLSRRTLDEALLQRAIAAGARVVRGTAIRNVRAAGASLSLESGSGGIEAHTLFLASGKHEVPGVKRAVTQPANDLIGFKALFTLSARQQAALNGAIEVILFEGGYAGLQMIEGGLANLCLLVRRGEYERAGKTWEAWLAHLCDACPYLAARLDGAVPALERPLTIARVPYGFLHRPGPDEASNLFRLGDQAGVIPSFSGDGISIALHSARLATRAYLEGRSAAEFHGSLRGEIGRPIRLASLIDNASRAASRQRTLVRAAQAWPGAMRLVARLTRIPPSALRAAGLDARAQVGRR